MSFRPDVFVGRNAIPGYNNFSPRHTSRASRHDLSIDFVLFRARIVDSRLNCTDIMPSAAYMYIYDDATRDIRDSRAYTFGKF